MMINKELEDNINTLRIDARRRGLKQMTVEHLALILLKENSAVREMLVECSADINGLESKLRQYINSNVPTAKIYGDEPQPSESFRRVLKQALTKNKSRRSITGLHVLAALFSEPESYAAYYMQKYGIERLALLARLANESEAADERTSPAAAKSVKPGNDLVAQAAAGQLEKPYGRTAEVALLLRTLSCKYKNNALLVGAPGVGKTAIVHALAHHIAEGKAPPAMDSMRIMQVNIADLVAGTKYRGDFEQRIQQMVEKSRAHGNTVLFIDEIHTLIGSGAVSGGALDGANILKPILEEQNIRYIGATTQTDYRRVFEKDQALNRRFTKITVQEPDEDTLQLIIHSTLNRLSAHHGIEYGGAAAEAAITLSRRYLPGKSLPDKAIALLDEAGACAQLAAQTQPIAPPDIECLARQAAGLAPVIAEQQKAQLMHLQQRLADAVLQQEEAAQRLARAVICDQLNYRARETVIAAFLFYGPTGVGKTEMARQLATCLDMPFLRYDMSEYMERHAVSRLIGAPPGYVGFEQSGRLIEEVAQNPLAVLLFDEVEKAHPDVLNILLQILDYGTLTDSSGRSVDFRNALIILTSNLGSHALERGAAGFDRQHEQGHGDDEMRHFFSPEMRNRLDALIRFHPLLPQTVTRIVDRQLAEAIGRIERKKNIRIRLDMALRRRLYKEGYSPAMGARPLQRLIKEQVLEPLALAEAGGDLHGGEKYRLGENGITRLQRTKSRQRQAVIA